MAQALYAHMNNKTIKKKPIGWKQRPVDINKQRKKQTQRH
jgi:hypothetical protein